MMRTFGSTGDADVQDRLTQEEAQAVIGMWSLQQRLNSNGDHRPTVVDLAEGLSISPEAVQAYLDQVRATPPVLRKTGRSKKQDIRLAAIFVAMAAFLFIGAAIFASVRASRSRAPRPARTSLAADGMTELDYRYYLPESLPADYSSGPNRFAFSVGTKLFESYNPDGLKSAAQLEKAITDNLGGPLADNSSVVTSEIDEATIAQALKTAPAERVGPPGTFRPDLVEQASSLVEWQTVQVAFGGKVVSAEIPFARVSEPKLLSAVREAQKRLIHRLAESGTSLSNRG
jgi:hypothetical protein